MKRYKITLLLLLALMVLWGCGSRSSNADDRKESRKAKQLLQGVWSDEDTETVVFKMQGDSVYYPDSTAITSYFRVLDDTLYIGTSARYAIVKHTEHLLWFKGLTGEIVKLVKDNPNAEEVDFEHDKPEILSLTEVLKRDTVVSYDGNRYHLYIAVNPTRYKVVRTTTNDDGLEVENEYYDNIIHLSIFRGSDQIFSSDFKKQQYQQKVDARFLTQSILNNMEYDHVDAQGFHLNVSLCAPDEASCYLIENIISFDGKLSTKLLEY